MAINGLTQIRDKNTLAVFQEIILSDGILRSDISKRTGISLMTVGKIMDLLAKRKIIYERELNTTTAGRKPALAFLNRDEWWICVFSLTDHVSFSILSLDLKVLHTESALVVDDNWHTSMNQQIVRLLEYMEKNYLKKEKLIGLGVSAPAPYSAEHDRVICISRPNLKFLKLHHMLSEHFNAPIIIDEDVKLAAIASLDTYSEYRNSNVFYMYIGVGVGGVLLNQGEIYRGVDNYAGDIGQFIFPDGSTVEQHLTWNLLQQKLAKLGIDIYSTDAPDSPELREIIDDYAKIMALSVYNAVCMYSPSAVIIDGMYHPLGSYFYDCFQKYYGLYFNPYDRVKPKVHFSFGGMDGAVLGLGYIIRKRWLLQHD